MLLVSSSKEPDKWVVPGGGIEPDEQPHLAALREVREEAGVEGHLGRCLGVFEVSVSTKQHSCPEGEQGLGRCMGRG